MTALRSTSLRTVLLADAITCVGAGLFMSAGAGVIARLTSISPALLLYAGLSLLPIAAFMAFVATRAVPPVPAIWLVIGGNALWVAASLWLMLGGAIQPNALGHVFIAAQAAVVAVLTFLEYDGVTRMPSAA